MPCTPMVCGREKNQADLRSASKQKTPKCRIRVSKHEPLRGTSVPITSSSLGVSSMPKRTVRAAEGNVRNGWKEADVPPVIAGLGFVADTAVHRVGDGRLRIEGSLADNLRGAIQSAQRLQNHPVHSDTVAYWRALLTDARQALREGGSGELQSLKDLVVTLEALFAERRGATS